MATKKKKTSAVAKRNAINVPGLADIVLPVTPVDTGLNREDIVLPRIRMLQPVSQDVTDGIGTAGGFMNSVTGEVLPDALEVLIFTHFKSRVMFGEAGIECMSPDGIEGSVYGLCSECDFLNWKDRIPPACALVHNYPCYILNAGIISGTPLPIALSMMKTSSKTARKLNTMVAMSHRNWFDSVFKISTTKVKNDKGTFFVYQVEKLRDAEEDEQKLGYWAYKQFAGKMEVAEETQADGFQPKKKGKDGKIPF